MPRETPRLESAVLQVFARDPERWFSLTDLFFLIRATDAETQRLLVPPSKTSGIRKALMRLEERGLAFHLGCFPPEGSKRGARSVATWGPPEAVITQARVVESQLGAQWVNAELLAAAISALSQREAGNLTEESVAGRNEPSAEVARVGD
jgi:hypothetical protein